MSQDEIDLNQIRWNIHVEPREDTGGVVVVLSWGWTAGMSKERLERLADDSPTGFDYVLTMLRDAVSLRDKLTEAIERFTARDAELAAAWEEKKRPMDERLRKAFPLLGDE